MNERRYAAIGAMTGAANALLSAVVVAIAVPFILRGAGLSSYGVWSICSIFVSIGAALELGLGRAVAILCAGRSPHERASNQGAAVILALIICGLALVVLLALRCFAPSVFPAASVPEEVRDVLWLAGAGIVAASVAAAVARGALEARLCLPLVNIGFLLQTVFYYGGAALATAFGWGVRGMIVSAVGAHVFIALLMLFFAFRDDVSAMLELSCGSRLAEVARVAVSSTWVGLPVAVLYPVVGLLALRFAESTAEYGRFELAMRVAILGSTAVASLGAPFLGLVSARRGSLDTAIRQHIWLYVRMATGCLILGLMLLALLGPAVVRWALGVEDQALINGAIAMTAGFGVMAAAEPLMRTMLASRMFRELFGIRLIILLLTLVGIAAVPASMFSRFAGSLAVAFAVGAFVAMVLSRQAGVLRGEA